MPTKNYTSSALFYNAKSRELVMYREQLNSNGLRLSSLPFGRVSLDDADVDEKVLGHFYSDLVPLDPTDTFSSTLYLRFLEFAGYRSEEDLKKASIELGLIQMEREIIAERFFYDPEYGGSGSDGEFRRIYVDEDGTVVKPIVEIIAESATATPAPPRTLRYPPE